MASAVAFSLGSKSEFRVFSSDALERQVGDQKRHLPRTSLSLIVIPSSLGTSIFAGASTFAGY
eukprot:42612-Amorphochlora_amoeboformis.AAC.1